MISPREEKPEVISDFADFMLNGSDEEHQRLFQKVIEEAVQDQLAVIAKADKMEAEERARANERVAVSAGA